MAHPLSFDNIPPIIDVPPPPKQDADPLLGEPLYHVEIAWQRIIRGMAAKGFAVRIHSQSDRSILYKTAQRLKVTIQTRQDQTRTTKGECWIAQVITAGSAEAVVALDSLVPHSRVARGHSRAVALMVLERGSVTLTDPKEAQSVYKSCRRFVWKEKLGEKREAGAVVLTPEGPVTTGDFPGRKSFVIKVSDGVRDRFQAFQALRTKVRIRTTK